MTTIQQRTKRLAILHAVCGTFICLATACVFIFPGIIAHALDAVFVDLPNFTSSKFIEWLCAALVNMIIFIAFAWIIVLAPYVAAFLFVFMGLPSAIGGYAYLNKKEWGLTILRIVSFLYVLIFPLGTLLAIMTWVRLSRYKRSKTAVTG